MHLSCQCIHCVRDKSRPMLRNGCLRYEMVPWIQYALSTPSISCVVVIALCQNVRIIAQTFSICVTMILHHCLIYHRAWSHSDSEYSVLISAPTLLLRLSFHHFHPSCIHSDALSCPCIDSLYLRSTMPNRNLKRLLLIVTS